MEVAGDQTGIACVLSVSMGTHWGVTSRDMKRSSHLVTILTQMMRVSVLLVSQIDWVLRWNRGSHVVPSYVDLLLLVTIRWCVEMGSVSHDRSSTAMLLIQGKRCYSSSITEMILRL